LPGPCGLFYLPKKLPGEIVIRNNELCETPFADRFRGGQIRRCPKIQLSYINYSSKNGKSQSNFIRYYFSQIQYFITTHQINVKSGF
jgi:hypothetical protein